MTPREFREDLAAVGVEVDDIWDLVNERKQYRKAVPVLLRWLPQVVGRTQEGVVRALTVPVARPAAAEPLLDLFEDLDDANDTGLRWVIGNALSVVCTREHLPRLLKLASDPKYRRARQMIIYKLGDFADPVVLPVLVELLEDSEVSGQATRALGRLGAPEAVPHLERMATSDVPLARRNAKKALKKL